MGIVGIEVSTFAGIGIHCKNDLDNIRGVALASVIIAGIFVISFIKEVFFANQFKISSAPLVINCNFLPFANCIEFYYNDVSKTLQIRL